MSKILNFLASYIKHLQFLVCQHSQPWDFDYTKTDGILVSRRCRQCGAVSKVHPLPWAANWTQWSEQP